MPIGRTWYYIFMVLLSVHLSLQDDINKKILKIVSDLDTKLIALNDKIDKQDKLLKQAVCKLWCTNDQCTSSNNCFCNVDWNENEDKWDITVCENGCIHGTCSAPNSCTCDLGWTGDQCDTEKCPEADGFFTTSASDQCFKAFRDKKRRWTDADSFCKSQGMQMARPYDHNAVEIRKYLNEKYGGAYYYLGCHGTGSVFKWLRDGQELPANSPLWHPRSPDAFTSDRCLFLTANDSEFNKYPGKPYGDIDCSATDYPLCERIMGQL